MTSDLIPDRPNAVDVLRSIVSSPAGYAREWKRRSGGVVVGTFCSYVPEEVILAAGGLPYRILQVPGEFSQADAALQAYACCLARGALELGSTGGLDFLDGVIFSNTCDTMQCLADIWSANVQGRFVETFMIPVHLRHPAARDYLATETRRLIDAVADRLGKTISPASLSEAARTCRNVRRVLGDLHAIQRGPSPTLTPREYYDAMMARWILPPNEYRPLIEALLNDPHPVDPVSPRIVVTGGPLYGTPLPDLLTELGACWVADDLCTGQRGAWLEPPTEGDPVAAIVDRLLRRPLCPTKHAADHDPGRVVVEQARDARADGVILYRLKFCEPHAFDYPRIKEALDAAGMPSLLVEVETPTGSIGQVRTRLQAFLEMLAQAAEART